MADPPEPDAVDHLVAQWEAERPDLAFAAMGTIGRLGRLHALVLTRIENVFAEHGLQLGEFDVLAALRRSGEPFSRSPGELARTLMLSPAGMTGRLDRLEAAGWVRREAVPDDRRSIRVVLTDEGRRLVDAAVTDHVANEERLLAGLSGRQRDALDDAVRTLLGQLER